MFHGLGHSRVTRAALTTMILMFLISAPIVHSNDIPNRSPLWTTSDSIVGIGISSDGSLVAYATSSEIKVYDGDGDLLWSRSYSNMNFKAVAVSRDGGAVVAVASTINGEYYLMYWDNIALLSGNPEPK